MHFSGCQITVSVPLEYSFVIGNVVDVTPDGGMRLRLVLNLKLFSNYVYIFEHISVVTHPEGLAACGRNVPEKDFFGDYIREFLLE